MESRPKTIVRWLFVAIFLLTSNALYAALSIRDNTGRAQFLSNLSTIVKPNEVKIDEYIASFNYNYKIPDRDFKVATYLSNNNISNKGNENNILQIGIQAAAVEYSKLPKLNISFVIDTSGSMKDEHKIDWVKTSFKSLGHD